MPGPTNESNLVKLIVRALKERYPDAYILKIHGGQYQAPGIPDLLLCVEGMFIGMEVKHQKPNESADAARHRATSLQRIHIQRIMASSGMAGVVLTPEDALDMVDRALHKRASILACQVCSTPTKFGGLCDYCAQTYLPVTTKEN